MYCDYENFFQKIRNEKKTILLKIYCTKVDVQFKYRMSDI